MANEGKLPQSLQNMQFDFQSQGPSETSFGNYLRQVFATSGGSIPEAIQNHFTSTAPLPSSLPSIPGYPKPGDAPQAQRPAALDALGEACSSGGAQQAMAVGGASQPQASMDGTTIAPSESSNSGSSSAASPVPSPAVGGPLDGGAGTQSRAAGAGGSSASVEAPSLASLGTSHAGTLTVRPPPQLSLVPSLSNGSEQQYAEITDYLNMPQSEAAKKLGIPPSTLSKRWKEAARNRKWPWRTVCKVDKEITTLLHNIPAGGPIPAEIEGNLGALLRKRQEELRPVVIRL